MTATPPHTDERIAAEHAVWIAAASASANPDQRWADSRMNEHARIVDKLAAKLRPYVYAGFGAAHEDPEPDEDHITVDLGNRTVHLTKADLLTIHAHAEGVGWVSTIVYVGLSPIYALNIDDEGDGCEPR